MSPQDWLMLAAGEAVFLAAMVLVVWLVRRDLRERLAREQTERELHAAVDAARVARRFVMVRKTEPMDDARLCMALSQLGDNHPTWLAVNQILQEQIDNATTQVSAPNMAGEPGAMAHTAGGIEWMKAVQLALWEAKAGERGERRAA